MLGVHWMVDNGLQYCCCSVVKSCPTVCDLMDCSTPGFPVLHHLLEFVQTHVHCVDDVIQTSHPLSPPSPLTFNLSQHWGLFQSIPSQLFESGGQSYWSFSFSPSNEYLGLISFIVDWFWSPGSPRDSQESSPTPQFESINSLVLSLLYGSTLTSGHDCWRNHSFDYIDLCWHSDVSAF